MDDNNRHHQHPSANVPNFTASGQFSFVHCFGTPERNVKRERSDSNASDASDPSSPILITAPQWSIYQRLPEPTASVGGDTVSQPHIRQFNHAQKTHVPKPPIKTKSTTLAKQPEQNQHVDRLGVFKNSSNMVPDLVSLKRQRDVLPDTGVNPRLLKRKSLSMTQHGCSGETAIIMTSPPMHSDPPQEMCSRYNSISRSANNCLKQAATNLGRGDQLEETSLDTHDTLLETFQKSIETFRMTGEQMKGRIKELQDLSLLQNDKLNASKVRESELGKSLATFIAREHEQANTATVVEKGTIDRFALLEAMVKGQTLEIEKLKAEVQNRETLTKTMAIQHSEKIKDLSARISVLERKGRESTTKFCDYSASDYEGRSGGVSRSQNKTMSKVYNKSYDTPELHNVNRNTVYTPKSSDQIAEPHNPPSKRDPKTEDAIRRVLSERARNDPLLHALLCKVANLTASEEELRLFTTSCDDIIKSG